MRNPVDCATLTDATIAKRKQANDKQRLSCTDSLRKLTSVPDSYLPYPTFFRTSQNLPGLKDYTGAS